MRYIAVFQPQAWINDYAVNVNVRGPAEWDVTDHLLSLSEHKRRATMEADSWDGDTLRNVPNAPRWAREWVGPFYISVREKE